VRSSHVGFSAFGSSKGEGSMSFYISKPRTPKHRKRPESGPQYHGAVSAVHPKGTPGARLGSSPFRPSRLRSARSSSVIFPRREVPRASRTWGPQHRRVSSGPSDMRGTRGAQLSHLGVSLIATVISKD
jgi:hypothetical protein